jgi:2-polyprenyl-3-methyl-5-hydroxy-6-metoxy-1,4-benzoquinol methylase
MTTSPLTKTDNVSLLKQVSADQLIRDWKRDLDIDISDELNGASEVSLYECNQTKLRFFTPVDTAGSGRLYAQLQKFDWYYMPHKWEYGVAFKDLMDCKNILEVGAAFGGFVEAGIKKGLSIQGIELNEAAVRTAQQRNIPVSFINLNDFAMEYPESQDAVCSFQVLEHISDPTEFIQWSIDCLKPGGKLIFCVPNVESFLGLQSSILDMPPHHMLQWSEQSFKSLENLFSIKLEKIEREPLASYHVPYYVRAYGNYFRGITPLNRLLFNRLTMKMYDRVLNLGLRKKLIGQSIYVQFRKIS